MSIRRKVRTTSLRAMRARLRSTSPPETLVFLRSGYRSVNSRNSWPMVSTASATTSLPPAGAGVMLLMIDEAAGRDMAAGAAHVGIIRERLCEQRFAATLRFADLAGQPAAGTETLVRQEVDILKVSDDGVEHDRRRLRPGK